MIKKLTRTGNTVALVPDKQLLDTVIAPVRGRRDIDRMEHGKERMHAKFAGAFRRLAK